MTRLNARNLFILILNLGVAMALNFYATRAHAVPQPSLLVGPEFQVNTFTDGPQVEQAVAMDADGDFVIVWQSDDQDGLFLGVYGQRYASDGSRRGAEFLVNTDTGSSEGEPAVAMDAAGNFVVVWSVSAGDNSIRAQRFAADGSKLGVEVQIDATRDPVNDPEIAMRPTGEYVVVWSRFDGGSDFTIFGRRFSANGVAAGPEFVVSTQPPDGQLNPDIAMAADGSFLVVWEYDDPALPGSGDSEIFARRFAADGTPAGNSFIASTTGVSQPFKLRPSVGMNALGQTVVTWNGVSPPAIFGQRFAAGGAPLGGSFRVDNPADGDGAENSEVLVYRDGGFLIVWEEANIESNDAVIAQRFNPDGTAVGADVLQESEFVVNTFPDGSQFEPVIVGDADDDTLVAWTGGGDQDGDDNGVFAQRLSGAENVDLALTKQDAVDPVAPGASVQYTLTVTNQHVVDANAAVGVASGVRVTDTLPAGVVFQSAAGTDWVCAHVAGVVGCDYQSALLPMTSASVAINVQAPNAATVLSNTAFVSGRQFDANEANAAGSNNFDREDTTVGSPAPSVVQFGAASYSVAEADGTVLITVTRSGGSGAVSVNYTTASNTAVADSDFTSTSGTLNFASGVNSQSFSVPILSDTRAESSETFSVRLSGAAGGATLGTPDRATVTIIGTATAPPSGGGGALNALALLVLGLGALCRASRKGRERA